MDRAPTIGSMRLLLIRHGQTDSNVRGALDTAVPGAPLTELGHRQAAAVAAVLADERLAGIHASPLVRTQQTATPLATARNLDIEVHEGLAEISAGELEMRGDDEARQAYADCLAAWMYGDLDQPMPGGPDGHEFLGRYDTAISAVTDHRPDDETVALFSHGAAIRVYTALRAGLTGDEATSLSIMNTGAALLDGDPETGWRLAHWSTDPLGGAHLVDAHSHDITGDSVDEEQAETDPGA